MLPLPVMRLKKLLEQEGISANELSKKVGVSSSAIYYILEGAQPRISTIEKIVSAFPQYSKEWLLGTDMATNTDSAELTRLREENAWLKQLVSNLTAQVKQPVSNFLNALSQAGAALAAQLRVAA